MKQKPLHEVEAEAAQRAIEELYAIRPDLYTEEMRKVIYHVARSGARTMTELLMENAYIATRTTGAVPPPTPAPKTDPMLAMLSMLGQGSLNNQTKFRTEDLAVPAINLALDVLSTLFTKPAPKK